MRWIPFVFVVNSLFFLTSSRSLKPNWSTALRLSLGKVICLTKCLLSKVGCFILVEAPLMEYHWWQVRRTVKCVCVSVIACVFGGLSAACIHHCDSISSHNAQRETQHTSNHCVHSQTSTNTYTYQHCIMLYTNIDTEVCVATWNFNVSNIWD